MVTGGHGSGRVVLDNTEIFNARDNVWSILPSAALPSPTAYFSAGKIDDTIFVIGKNVHFRNHFRYMFQT